MATRSRRMRSRARGDAPTRLPFGSDGPCERLVACQACPLLPLPYEAQLTHKRDALRAALSHADLPDLESIAINIDSPEVAHETSEAHPLNASLITRGYRYTAKPAVRRGAHDDELEIGLYQPGSHALIDLGDCWVQSPLINQLLSALKRIAPAHGIQGYQEGDELSCDSARLRYVVARQSYRPQDSSRDLTAQRADLSRGEESAALHLTLIVTREPHGRLTALAQDLSRACPALVGVALHLNRSTGNAIFDAQESTRHLWGDDALETRVRFDPREPPLALRVSATSFAQVNPRVAERAYRAIVEVLAPRPGDRLIDLYCGVGVIGICLAWAARRAGGALAELWGVEEAPSSVRDARENARRLSVAEAHFLEGRAEDQLQLLIARLRAQDQPHEERGVDLVVLNPSRRGCQSIVLEQLVTLRPRKIAYMSCHARTLARDLKRLRLLGYHATQITLFDMFPGSAHYETVTVLEPL